MKYRCKKNVYFAGRDLIFKINHYYGCIVKNKSSLSGNVYLFYGEMGETYTFVDTAFSPIDASFKEYWYSIEEDRQFKIKKIIDEI